MDNDDLYPNDSSFLGGVPLEPKDQLIERQKERARTLEAKKELEIIIDHLKSRIEATDSIKQALELAAKYEISRAEALIIFDIVRQQLEVEQEYINDLLEVHAKHR